MPLAELMSQIQQLSKIDKLRLMQFLATELVKESVSFVGVLNLKFALNGYSAIGVD